MWPSVRQSPKLRPCAPWWLAILLFAFVVFAMASFREREVARGSQRVAAPVQMGQRGVTSDPAFAADELRTRLERLTNVLIALTGVLVMVTVLILTRG